MVTNTATEASPTAFVPPPGSTPGANRMPLTVSSIVGACFLAGCFIAIRFYVRTKITKVLGMDDWFVLAAGMMLWTNGCVGIWGGTLGMTHQAWEVPKENFPLMQKVGYGSDKASSFSFSQPLRKYRNAYANSPI